MTLEMHKAIPQGYMTVGEIAKKMNTTVRTLQYYDKIGLLSPSAESEGGRRLYTDSDIVKLHRIQSMKYLGFSLDAIKNWVIFLETPEEVADALEEQAQSIREEIASLTENLADIEKLREETLRMQTVDWNRYACILVNLRMKNQFYGVIKYLDDKTFERFHNSFGVDVESCKDLTAAIDRLCGEIAALQKKGAAPQSAQGQRIAKEWWNVLLNLADGNAGIAGQFIKSSVAECQSGTRSPQMAAISLFLDVALRKYFADNGINPFEGDDKNECKK